MRPFHGARAGVLPGSRARPGGECIPDRSSQGGAIAVRALVLGGARSGKSAFAERMARELGGDRVLYVATAEPARDADLEHRVRLHGERRPAGWETLELGGGHLDRVLEAAGDWRTVLFDSLTLWVSARMSHGDEQVLADLDELLAGATSLSADVILVSDEVGLGVVPASAEGRRFRDLLGLANQRVAAGAQEVYLCVAGIETRLK